MSFPEIRFEPLARAVCAAIEAHADELTELDRVIGDADHGVNMKRGFGAVAAKMDALAALPFGAALTETGKTLVMTVGGASGPLYGTLFMRLGAAWPAQAEPTRTQLAQALHSAVEAVKARGKATRGQKTMIDVLEPVAEFLGSAEPVSAAGLAACARAAAEATVPLRAERGRASFLVERSCGHMDPGARSCEIMLTALAGALETALSQKV